MDKYKLSINQTGCNLISSFLIYLACKVNYDDICFELVLNYFADMLADSYFFSTRPKFPVDGLVTGPQIEHCFMSSQSHE